MRKRKTHPICKWIETMHVTLNSTGIPYIKTISHSRTTRYTTAWGLNCKWLQWSELTTTWRRISFRLIIYVSLWPRCDANWNSLLTHCNYLCILLSTPALRRIVALAKILRQTTGTTCNKSNCSGRYLLNLKRFCSDRCLTSLPWVDWNEGAKCFRFVVYECID